VERVINDTLAAFAAVSVLFAVGCGSSRHHGYFEMTTLAAGIKAQARNSPPHEHHPSTVNCTQTGPVEASCILGFREPGSVREATFTETVKIAADGNSYEATRPHE
jgi:hypothetical protein